MEVTTRLEVAVIVSRACSVNVDAMTVVDVTMPVLCDTRVEVSVVVTVIIVCIVKIDPDGIT